MTKRKRLRQGKTKTVKGKTYKLGKTSRWERLKGKRSALIGGGIGAGLTAFPMALETKANIAVLKGVKKYGMKKGYARVTAAGSTASYLGAGLLAVGAGMKIGSFVSAKIRKKQGKDIETPAKMSRIGGAIMLGGLATTVAGTGAIVGLSKFRGMKGREMSAKGWKLFKTQTKQMGVGYEKSTLGGMLRGLGKPVPKQWAKSGKQMHIFSFYNPKTKIIVSPKRSAVAIHELEHAKQWARVKSPKLRTVVYGIGVKASQQAAIPGLILGSKKAMGYRSKKQIERDRIKKQRIKEKYSY